MAEQAGEHTPAALVDGRHLWRGVLFAILGGVCWGFSGTCAQFLFGRYGVDPRWIISVRFIGAGVLFMLLAVACERAGLRAVLRSPRDLAGIAFFAVAGIGACQFCYLNAIRTTDAGIATVLQSLNLVIILAVMCIAHRRRPTLREGLGVVLAVGGTFLIATHGTLGSLAITSEGLAWGLVTAVAAALYTLIPGRLLREHGSVVVTGLAMVAGAIFSTPVFRPWTIAPQLDLVGVAAVASIVVIGTFLAFLLFLSGIKLVGSMLAGLLGCSEPICACILSSVWLGTTFMPIDIVGIGMIIAMMFLVA